MSIAKVCRVTIWDDSDTSVDSWGFHIDGGADEIFWYAMESKDALEEAVAEAKRILVEEVGPTGDNDEMASLILSLVFGYNQEDEIEWIGREMYGDEFWDFITNESAVVDRLNHWAWNDE